MICSILINNLPVHIRNFCILHYMYTDLSTFLVKHKVARLCMYCKLSQ